MTHGDHWNTIYPDQESMLAAIRHTIEHGVLPEHHQPFQAPDGPLYRYLHGPDRPLTATVIVKAGDTQNEVVGMFPTMLDLEENELEVYSNECSDGEDEEQVEGMVTAITREGTEVLFFCPAWLAYRGLFDLGGRYQFGLGALVYSIELAPREIVMTEGGFFEMEKKRRMAEDPGFDPATFTSVSLSVANLRTFIAREDGDFEFQSVVEEITPFTSMGTTGLMLTVSLTQEDHQRIAVRLYATASVLDGQQIAVGDPVRGVAWLQGMPAAKVEAEDSWMDSAEAAQGSGNDGVMAMAAFMFGNPQLPLAFQVVGAAMAGAGWEIVSTEQKRFRSWAPAFHARRRDADFWVFVRTAISGVFEAPPFAIDRGQTDEYAAGHQARCLWVTVTLEPMDKSFAVTAEGLEEFAEELCVPLQVRRPEEFKVVDVGQMDDDVPDPVLDESHAAAVFAEAINQGDLAEFSKLLVEDLDYSSATTKVCILGRHHFLNYMGTHLDKWIGKGQPLTAAAGRLPPDGSGRPCVITYDTAGKAVACTIFTGRKGHVAVIETLSPSVFQ